MFSFLALFDSIRVSGLWSKASSGKPFVEEDLFSSDRLAEERLSKERLLEEQKETLDKEFSLARTIFS